MRAMSCSSALTGVAVGTARGGGIAVAVGEEGLGLENANESAAAQAA
jgi:hypothetical protein